MQGSSGMVDAYSGGEMGKNSGNVGAISVSSNNCEMELERQLRLTPLIIDFLHFIPKLQSDCTDVI